MIAVKALLIAVQITRRQQASRILPHKFPQKTPNCNPACSSPHLPTRLCPLRRVPLIKQNP
jgi:hypothetical protein